MKRILILSLLLLTVLFLPVKANAATNETSIQLQATVSADSSCQVKINATIYKETPGVFYFSVPQDAVSVTLNGVSVQTVNEGNTKLIPLSDQFGTGTGTFPFAFLGIYNSMTAIRRIPLFIMKSMRISRRRARPFLASFFSVKTV